MKNFAIVSALLTLLIAAPAFAFTPFTVVKNVCETCEQPPADVITLSTGQTLRANVVGENPSFYVVVRYSEVRAIPRAEVRSVKWQNGSKPPAVSSSTQVLLKNGYAFAGSIIEDKSEPALIQLKSSYNDQTYILFKSEIQEAYTGNMQLDISVSSP